jgi:hypothetical protein
MKALLTAFLILTSTALPTQRDVEGEEILHFFVL